MEGSQGSLWLQNCSKMGSQACNFWSPVWDLFRGGTPQIDRYPKKLEKQPKTPSQITKHVSRNPRLHQKNGQHSALYATGPGLQIRRQCTRRLQFMTKNGQRSALSGEHKQPQTFCSKTSNRTGTQNCCSCPDQLARRCTGLPAWIRRASPGAWRVRPPS